MANEVPLVQKRIDLSLSRRDALIISNALNPFPHLIENGKDILFISDHFDYDNNRTWIRYGENSLPLFVPLPFNTEVVSLNLDEAQNGPDVVGEFKRFEQLWPLITLGAFKGENFNALDRASRMMLEIYANSSGEDSYAFGRNFWMNMQNEIKQAINYGDFSLLDSFFNPDTVKLMRSSVRNSGNIAGINKVLREGFSNQNIEAAITLALINAIERRIDPVRKYNLSQVLVARTILYMDDDKYPNVNL